MRLGKGRGGVSLLCDCFATFRSRAPRDRYPRILGGGGDGIGSRNGNPPSEKVEYLLKRLHNAAARGKNEGREPKEGAPGFSMHEKVQLLDVVLGTVALFGDKRPPIASLGVPEVTKHYNTLLVLACWSGC